VQVAAPPITASRLNILHWTKFALLIAPPLVMWGVGILWLHLNSRHGWAQSEVAAVIVGFVLLSLLLEQTLRAPRYNRIGRTVGLAIGAIILFILPLLNVPDLAAQQAQQYADAGAYALALQTYADVGKTSGAAIANLQLSWAQTALGINDFATAVRHLRAAGAAYPKNDGTYETMLLSEVKIWGEGLFHEGQFSAAIQVFQDQSHSWLCDASCRQAMATEIGTAYRALGDSALIADRFGDAQQAYQTLANNYASTDAGQATTGASQEVSAQSLVINALQAGQGGDIASMNRQLQALVAQYPQTSAAGEAKEAPEPVGGVILDGSGNPASGERLYFGAYTSRNDASNFGNNNVLIVATTIATNGTFTVRLQPGYWYVPFWEEPNLSLGQVNVSSASDLSAFYLSAYTPVNLGTIHGAV
jgi:hypothetical protein